MPEDHDDDDDEDDDECIPSESMHQETTGTADLQTKVALRLHAVNLPRHGIRRSLPDTYAVVTSVAGRFSHSGPLQRKSLTDHVMDKTEWGRTEIVHKSCRPQWTTTFPLKYEFGTECYFFVRIFRVATGSPRKTGAEGESLGDAVFEIGDILGSKNHMKIRRLPKGGIIFCRMEPIREVHQNKVFRFQFAARDLVVGRKGLASLSPFSSAPDTILQISKRQPRSSIQTWAVIYRSRPVENSANPCWDVGEVDVESMCNGDWDRPIRLTILTYRKNAQDIQIGECETTLRAIVNSQADSSSTTSASQIIQDGFPLQRSMKKAKLVGRLKVKLAQVMDQSGEDGYGDDGSSLLSCDDTTYSHEPYAIDISALPQPIASPATFRDYMDSGWRLDFTVAIDFTSSNGDPRIPGTLHDQSPVSLNDYEETIVSIGNAVAPYTMESLLGATVWGFGCKFGGVLRHIFQCGPDPKVFGVESILKAYRSVSLSDVTMSGPTVFDQVLQAAAVQAKKYQQDTVQRYVVLLVITDGIADQLEETKRKLGVYSQVPLSVIFVGVGRADFSAMHRLVEGHFGNRDVASFVEFRRHQHDPSSLGRNALEKLPSQLIQYMLQHNITP